MKHLLPGPSRLLHVIQGMLVLCVLALGIAALPTETAHASGTPLASANISSCPGEGVASRFVPCVRRIIVNTAYSFFDEVYPILEFAIYAAMTLSVAFFGAMLITQMIPTPKASTETFMLIVKIGCVVAFTQNLHWMYDTAIAIMDGLIDAVTNYTFTGVGGASVTLLCPANTQFNTSGFTAAEQVWMRPWQRIDCVLDRIIGISSGAGQEISNGILAFLWDNAFSGAMGVLIFLAGLYMIANLVMGFFRTAAQYIISLLILVMVVMISLIFIPMILFKNTAMEFFKRWLRQLVSTILQPVIVFAFISVLLTALDYTMFSGPNSFYRTVAGDASNNSGFSLSRYMVTNDLYRRVQAGPYTQDLAPAPGQPPTADAGSRDGMNLPDNPRARTPGSLTEILVGIEYKEIDWAKLYNIRNGGPAIGAGPPEVAMRQAAGNSLLMSIITVFLLLQVLSQIPYIAQDLTSGIREGVNTGGLARGVLSMGQGVSTATGNITERLGGLVTRRAGGAVR